MACAIDHHVVELDAVRTFQVLRGLWNLDQPLHAHRPGRKIDVAVVLDDIAAFGDDLAVEGCFHGSRPPRTEAMLESGGLKRTPHYMFGIMEHERPVINHC